MGRAGEVHLSRPRAGRASGGIAFFSSRVTKDLLRGTRIPASPPLSRTESTVLEPQDLDSRHALRDNISWMVGVGDGPSDREGTAFLLV